MANWVAKDPTNSTDEPFSSADLLMVSKKLITRRMRLLALSAARGGCDEL